MFGFQKKTSVRESANPIYLSVGQKAAHVAIMSELMSHHTSKAKQSRVFWSIIDPQWRSNHSKYQYIRRLRQAVVDFDQEYDSFYLETE